MKGVENDQIVPHSLILLKTHESRPINGLNANPMLHPKNPQLKPAMTNCDDK